VHLDVKPSNLLIAADGALKLGDFGLVAPLGERPVDGAEGDDRYLSAECLRGDHEHAASVDVFALGISILELSTRAPLPASGDKWHALRRNGAPRLPAASDAFDALVKRCMDADPRRRPAAAELASHPLASTADSKATWLALAARAAPPPPTTRDSLDLPPRSSKSLATPSGAGFAFF